MQSSTASHAGTSHSWGNPNPSNMYSGTHQRSTSNPRAYTAADPSSLAGRRDDASSQGMYAGDDNYAAYQHAGGYGGIGGYAGYSSGVNLGGYAAASSPSAPSGSRRTSGPKLATPPQASSSAANPSPSSRYYQTAAPQGGDASGHHQSPYQPSSAPPQVLSHHQSGIANQPQTAHPYASQYQQHYYDQQGQHHPSSGQWAGYPPSSYAQQSAAPRTSTTHSSTTPTLPQSATVGDSHSQGAHRASSGNAGTPAYDYPPTASAYQGWSAHDQSRGPASQQQAQQAWQQQQSGSNRASQSQAGQPSMMQPGAWQGYPGHSSMPQTMPPHHMASGHVPPGQYGWQPQQWNSQGYGYPPPAPHAQPAPPAPVPGAAAVSATAPTGKKGKKEKAEKHAKPEKQPKHEKHGKHEKGDEYKGLGKRQVDSSADEGTDDKKEGKKKKGKKEEEKEKPPPKPPAKSHLHPPRQAQSAWQLFFTDELNKAKAAAAQGNSPGGTPHHAKLNVAQIAKDAGIAYSNLDNEQKKYYAQKVQESKEEYARELAIWQATLTPDDIKAENAFRAQQRKEGKSRKGNLKDPNAPKKPLSAYFLFLKGIRENDEIRAKVWGEESETTKQSVLAAERWRSLSDEEKKPYLQQAEHDKQEYEAARKIYEDEAAARARGEAPPRPVAVADPVTNHPLSNLVEAKEGESGEHPSSDPVKPSPPSGEANPSSEPNFPDFQQGDSRGSASNTPALGEGKEFEQSIEMDQFPGFADPLDDMDLTGLEGITGAGQNPESQWDELQKLMGTTDDGYEGGSGPEDKSEAKQEATAAPSQSVDVSVAPAFGEAVSESGDLQQQLPGQTEAQVQEIAASAEGLGAVPQAAPVAAQPEVSGVPTEAVNELPPAGVSVADNVSASAGATEPQPFIAQGLATMPAADGV